MIYFQEGTAVNTTNEQAVLQDTPPLDSTLIDLADLNFTTTPTEGSGQSIGSFLDTLPPGGCGYFMTSYNIIFCY